MLLFLEFQEKIPGLFLLAFLHNGAAILDGPGSGWQSQIVHDQREANVLAKAGKIVEKFSV